MVRRAGQDRRAGTRVRQHHAHAPARADRGPDLRRDGSLPVGREPRTIPQARATRRPPRRTRTASRSRTALVRLGDRSRDHDGAQHELHGRAAVDLRPRRRCRAAAHGHRARDRRLRSLRPARTGDAEACSGPATPARADPGSAGGPGSTELRPPGVQGGGPAAPFGVRSFPCAESGRPRRCRRRRGASSCGMAAQPRKILVGFDGSEASFARSTSRRGSSGTARRSQSSASVARTTATEGALLDRSSRAPARPPGRPRPTSERSVEPADEIVEARASLEADLVVVGRRARDSATQPRAEVGQRRRRARRAVRRLVVRSPPLSARSARGRARSARARHGSRAELLHDVRPVRLGRAHRDVEQLRDLLVRVPEGEQAQHLALALRERVRLRSLALLGLGRDEARAERRVDVALARRRPPAPRPRPRCPRPPSARSRSRPPRTPRGRSAGRPASRERAPSPREPPAAAPACPRCRSSGHDHVEQDDVGLVLERLEDRRSALAASPTVSMSSSASSTRRSPLGRPRGRRRRARGSARSCEGTSAASVVPLPGADSTSEPPAEERDALAHARDPRPSVAPAVRARSPARRPRRRPRPTGVRVSAGCSPLAPACLATFVSASWTMR